MSHDVASTLKRCRASTGIELDMTTHNENVSETKQRSHTWIPQMLTESYSHVIFLGKNCCWFFCCFRGKLPWSQKITWFAHINITASCKYDSFVLWSACYKDSSDINSCIFIQHYSTHWLVQRFLFFLTTSFVHVVIIVDFLVWKPVNTFQI